MVDDDSIGVTEGVDWEDCGDVDDAESGEGVGDCGSTEVVETISEEEAIAVDVKETVVVDCGKGVPEDCATTVVVESTEGDGLFVSRRCSQTTQNIFPINRDQSSCLPS